MCFVWIWEQTAIISPYNINWLFFITDLIPLQPSGHYMYRQLNIQQFFVLSTQFIMCFVWICEQAAIISLYNINWLVFITDI